MIVEGCPAISEDVLKDLNQFCNKAGTLFASEENSKAKTLSFAGNWDSGVSGVLKQQALMDSPFPLC